MEFYTLSKTAEALYFRGCAESSRLDHQYVEPVHFLLAMLTEIDSPAGDLLVSYGMTDPLVRPIVARLHPVFEAGKARVIDQLTPVSVQVFNASATLAQKRQTGGLATPLYILVILIELHDENVYQVFRECGVDPHKVAIDAGRSILQGVS